MGMRLLPATVPFGTGIRAVQRLCPVLSSHRRGRREKAFREPEGQLGGSCTVHSWPPQLQRQLAALRLHTRVAASLNGSSGSHTPPASQQARFPTVIFFFLNRGQSGENCERLEREETLGMPGTGLFQTKSEKEGSLGLPNHLRLSLSLLQRKFYHTNRKGTFYIKILKPLTHKYFRALTITDIYEVLIIS